MTDDLERKLRLATARAKRLKSARDQAERLLEQKSRELYQANLELEQAQKGLEDDIKQATYELSVSNQRLQRALNERSTFIGQMSHEVRTPLNAVLGLSEILLTTDLNEDQFDYVDTIKNAARSLTVLLSDMLDITKIEAGKLKINIEAVDIQRLHRNVISMFELEANAKATTIELDMSEDVPATLRVDQGRYRQILNNLVSNAIKNTDQGTVKVMVDYSDNHYSDGIGLLTVNVKDTGVGIPKHKLKTIFNAYEQLGNASQGVGLGLAICNQLCELMQGRLSCESELGKGSIFELTLPAEALVIDKQTLDDASHQKSSQHPPLNILLAEDNPTNQKVLAAQLAQLGQSATIVNNGAEAIARLRDDSFDIVFLDILMPVMDGEETLMAIRNSSQRISSHYCVALTASNYQEQRKRLLDLGFDEFLGKPLGLSELANVLERTSLRLHAPLNDSVTESDPQESTCSNQLYDYDYLKSQFGDLAETIFVEIAPTFVEHTCRNLVALEAALVNGNSDAIRKTSHSLKGSSASMGLMDLAAKFELMELQPNSNTVHQMFEELQIEWATILPGIRDELTRLQAQMARDSAC